MHCPKCGAAAGENDYACTKCRTVLRPPPPAPAEPAPDGFGGLIPTRNQPALIGYYLGVAAFIPVVGWLFGIPAFFLGLRGLRLVNENPAIRGRAHAWFAVIAGALCSVLYLGLTVFVFLRARRG